MLRDAIAVILSNLPNAESEYRSLEIGDNR